ncbi:MAG: hypothetical protein V2G42_05580 [bacterium JZ-2024 1]
MRAGTAFILGAMVILGLLAYFYLMPKFRAAQDTGTVGTKNSGVAGALQRHNQLLEEESGE